MAEVGKWKNVYVHPVIAGAGVVGILAFLYQYAGDTSPLEASGTTVCIVAVLIVAAASLAENVFV